MRTNEKTVLLYPGTLNYHQGLDLAVEAFAKIKDLAPEAEFHIYGDGPARQELGSLVSGFGLDGRVLLKDPVPLDEIVAIMASADIGVIPKIDDDFGGEAFSTKTLEFMLLGVPIVLSRTRIDDYYFDASTVRFFESGNVDGLAEAMLALIKNRQLRMDLAQKGLHYAKAQCWAVKKDVYLKLVDSLCKTRLSGSRI
jgi:glycosyltransferase involved in cell wall biosynthesis